MAKRDTLEFLKGLFEANACSQTYYQWQKRAVEDIGFYEGTGQWSSEAREEVKTEIGIEPITVNKIKPRIDNVSGMEVQSRTKVVYAPRSNNEGDASRADALSAIALWIEDQNDSTYLLSQVSQDGYKVGIGVHGFDVRNGRICEEQISPFDYVWDVSDRTSDLSCQRFGAVLRWKKREELKRQFPAKADEIDALVAGRCAFGLTVPGNDGTRLHRVGGYYDKENDEFLMVEQAYAKPETFYSVLVEDGESTRIVQTFDKKAAQKLAGKKGAVEERPGWRVYMAYFTADLLFDVFPYEYQLDPASGLLMWTPFVQFMTTSASDYPGVPYSNLCQAKDAQRLYNKSRTLLSWLNSSRQVIMEGDAADAEAVRTEAARPDGVLIVKPGKRLEINRHEAKIQEQQNLAIGYDKDIQDALGIFDEAMGMQTNAQSGVAIERRQIGTNRNQAVVLDRFRAMKKRWGFKLLRLIQSVVTEPQIFYVTDDDSQTKAVGVNGGDRQLLDGKGMQVPAPDIKVGAYDVTIQEVPDYSTMKDISRERVLQAAQAVGGFQNLTPDILQFFGVPPSDPMVKASEEGAHAQRVTQNAQALKAIEGGVVPTTTPAAGVPNTGLNG